MSPPLVVVHKKKVSVWKPGRIASQAAAAIFEDKKKAKPGRIASQSAAAIFEDANNPIAEVQGVKKVFTAEGGPIPPGESRTFSFTSYGKYAKVSLLTMLVNTNDAGTGLHGVRLNPVLSKRLFWKGAYDGGNEVNNELRSHIPGPCCGNPFVRDPEGAVIKPHPGITGVALKDGGLDPNVEGWDTDEPVVKIKLQYLGNGKKYTGNDKK